MMKHKKEGKQKKTTKMGTFPEQYVPTTLQHHTTTSSGRVLMSVERSRVTFYIEYRSHHPYTLIFPLPNDVILKGTTSNVTLTE